MLTYISGLNTGINTGNCGYNDWKLPSINELVTLINYTSKASTACPVRSN